jgi:hypothetical protein
MTYVLVSEDGEGYSEFECEADAQRFLALLAKYEIPRSVMEASDVWVEAQSGDWDAAEAVAKRVAQTWAQPA